MKSKKAAIGATTTWVVATIIILLVIIIFVYATKTLAGSEWAKDILKEQDSVKITKSSSGVDSEQMLLALLNTKVDGEILKPNFDKNYDEFKKDFDKIKSEIGPILSKFPKDKNDLGWTFIIRYLEPANEEQKRNPYFILGADPYSLADILETQGTGTRETYDCAFFYSINFKATLCKIRSL